MGNAVKTKIYSGGFEAARRADYPLSESQTRELPNSGRPELSSAMDLFRHYIGMMFLSLNAHRQKLCAAGKLAANTRLPVKARTQRVP